MTRPGARLFRRALACALSTLCLLCCAVPAPAAAEEVHTVLLPCGGGGFVGRSGGRMAAVTLSPETEVKTADGTAFTLAQLRDLPGFRLRAASLRWTVEGLEGPSLLYSLSLGKDYTRMLPVSPGRNLWDVTDLFSAWLRAPETPLRLIPMHWEDACGMQVADGSAQIRFTFTASSPVPLFPEDRVRQDPVLDAGLVYLEDGNPFLARYDDLADCLLTAQLPLGVPYYYAGRSEDKFLRRYHPETTTRYYQYENLYFCGLDCVGLTRLVYEKSGLERHPSIVDILHAGAGSAALRDNDPALWPAFLRTGDLIGVQHGYYHVMMYIGTLRCFGWTEETAGSAAPVLDSPLVLHCGGNPFYYDRYKAYIAEMGFRKTFPPDGGVTVAVIRPSLEGAPCGAVSAWDKRYAWYDLRGYPLLVFPLDDCTQMAWYSPESR